MRRASWLVMGLVVLVALLVGPALGVVVAAAWRMAVGSVSSDAAGLPPQATAKTAIVPNTMVSRRLRVMG